VNRVRTILLAAVGLLAAAVSAVFAGPAAAQAPNDPYWGLQWGPKQVRAAEAWPVSRGAGQTIAIVDSGVDLDHPDLAAKIAGGATFVCSKGARPCGNGDWQSGADNGAGHPHGTHVAGIAAAATGNGAGIAGTAPDASLLAVKVLDAEGSGNFTDIADGVRWSVDNGADVVNLSLGALPGAQAFVITGLISELQDAILYARSKGVVVVAAAGNDFVSPLCGTPAWDEGALCVVATDRNEMRAAYSNFALKPGLDAVAAPGGAAVLACREDIVSTVPVGAGTTPGYCEQREGTPGYDFYAGTSMASPHVAGVAALLTAQGRSDENVVAALERTARTPGTGTRGTYTPTYGYGIVDAQAAVAAP
jgi:subtilisin family serine protease